MLEIGTSTPVAVHLTNQRQGKASPAAAVGSGQMAADIFIKQARPAQAAAAPMAAVTGPAHVNNTLRATDGQPLVYRTSETLDKPRAIVVMMQSTYGKAPDFDGMGEKLAARGIKSYSITSRVAAPANFSQHAQDLNDVVVLARKENPGVPVSVMGVSLGATVALDWSARHSEQRTPVLALAPVVLPKFLGPKELLEVTGGTVSWRIGQATINSPMSAGKQLTTNPDGAANHLADPQDMKLPARLYSDVFRMVLNAGVHARLIKAPMFFGMGGEDKVGTNPATKAYATLFGSKDKTLQTFPTAAHDLGQEDNHPDVVEGLSDWILAHSAIK